MKNNRKKYNQPSHNLFDDEEMMPDNMAIDPTEMIENIPIEDIDKESQSEAAAMLTGTSDLFADKDWIASRPELKRRLDEEIESLRVLVKMRKSDEVTHDILLRGISANPANASLYKALTTIQSTLLSIQKQIDETKTTIQKILTGVQQETFGKSNNEEENEEDGDDIKQHYRGSKGFIEDMRKKHAVF